MQNVGRRRVSTHIRRRSIISFLEFLCHEVWTSSSSSSFCLRVEPHSVWMGYNLRLSCVSPCFCSTCFPSHIFTSFLSSLSCRYCLARGFQQLEWSLEIIQGHLIDHINMTSYYAYMLFWPKSQSKVIRVLNPDFRINSDSYADVCRIASKMETA